MTPRVTRITFTGPELAGFGPPRCGSHLKLFFPEANSAWTPGDETRPRPPLRTYTPRRFDPVRARLDVEFVHHGEGVAGRWAAKAKPGDKLFVAGPGGGYELPPEATEVVLVADETALPAAGSIIDELPASIPVRVLCEVEDAAEQRQISTRRDFAITWLHRADRNSVPSAVIAAAVQELPATTSTIAWWIACEAGAMRRIRNHLYRSRGVDASFMHTRGYWKLGEVAYPDHDYGKD